MNNEFLQKVLLRHQSTPDFPSKDHVISFFKETVGLLFPEHADSPIRTRDQAAKAVDGICAKLKALLKFQTNIDEDQVIKSFFNFLPQLSDRVDEDVMAMFEGDPAAKSRSEVVRTYPGFYAIMAYRIAHELLQLGVHEVPRIITEFAHSQTGIDIHPGAKIGSRFCIDHGTGVVIGETTLIGDRVKIYQGVTLGALSVSKEDAEKKRHPTIGDDVIIYAGATILGGNTVIGSGSIIGGNVWITTSVAACSRIYYQAKMSNGNTEQTDLIVFK